MEAVPQHRGCGSSRAARLAFVRIAWLALFLVVPIPAFAQQTAGRIAGRVVDAETGTPLSGAQIDLQSGTRIVASATAEDDGQFTFTGIPQGRYSLIFSSIGHETLRRDGVRVPVEGGTVNVGSVELASRALQLNPVVVTASREQEKALEAPASVYTVEAEEIREQPTTTPADHVIGLPGADVVTTGISQHNIVARGFNNVFSGALFVLTDNRWASVPSLRLNAYNLIPTTNEDIERIEFVLGPGSALYGPNVDKGVMHIITRSPLSQQETSVSFLGGEREVFQGTLRHAALASENVGYKVSGMYFRGRDWVFTDSVEARQAEETGNSLIGARDFDAERYTADARVDFRLNETGTLVLSGGLTRLANSIELTGLGAAKAQDWTYSYVQARFRSANFFAQSYANFSDAGESYLLRTGDLVSDNSLLYVGQVQHGTRAGERQSFIYGADLIRTVPKTDGTIHGQNEDEDDITELGGYLQSETRVSPMLDLVLAGRVDYHDVVDEVVFSPRAALVFKPTDAHSLRATYNRAFSQPTSVNLFLDLESLSRSPTQPFAVNGSGVPKTGFTFQRLPDGTPLMRTFWADFIPGVSEANPLPLDATLLWPVAVEVFRQSTGIDLSAIPAPTADDVGTDLRALNPTTEAFDAVPVSSVRDIDALKSTITNIIEVGYKGLVADRLLVGADVYYTRIEDFIGPLRTETPTVFLNREDVEAYLTPFVGAQNAAAVAAGMAGIAGSTQPTTRGIPLATVAPENTTAANPADILLSYRQFGDVDLWGVDLGATILAADYLSFSGSYSFISEKLFEDLDGVGDIALNAPKNKASLAAHLDLPRRGLRGELRGRYVDSFPVISGVYVGNVEDYTVFDALISYAPFFSRTTELTLSVTNVFDNRHKQMVGAPDLGRLVLLRLRQTF